MQKTVNKEAIMSLSDLTDFIKPSKANCFTFQDNLVCIANRDRRKDLYKMETTGEIISFKLRPAREIANFPEIAKTPRCPHVNLLCRGGLVIGKGFADSFEISSLDCSFKPIAVLYFWNVGFTGAAFNEVGLHQWRGFSWGLPEDADIIALDRWNIPGEIEKYNAQAKDLANKVVDAIRTMLHKDLDSE